MRLAILDANVLDMIQSGEPLAYLTEIVDLELVISRRAREETEEAGNAFLVALNPSQDAPVPMISNHPKRSTNDLAVLCAPTRGMKEEIRIRKSVYKNTTKHKVDQEILGSVVDLCERKREDPQYTAFYFISGDRQFCKKGHEYFSLNNIPIEVLYARQSNALELTGIREVDDVFVTY